MSAPEKMNRNQKMVYIARQFKIFGDSAARDYELSLHEAKNQEIKKDVELLL